MSPSVGNFVTDLVEMAKATEQLPIVERERDQLKADNDTLRDTIQSLQLRAIDRKEEVERLLATIRQLEVARDDAELRFLEVEDDAATAAILARDMQSLAERLITVLDPPKPQPEAIPEVVKAIEEVPALDPTGSSSAGQFQPEAPNYSKADAEPGQSEADPTSFVSTETGVGNISASVEESASQSKEPSLPFSGKRYYDMPTWISYHDWIAGGGTEEDYNWCPTAKTAW